MIGKGATPSFFAIANDNYTLTDRALFYVDYQAYNRVTQINQPCKGISDGT